jgi:hypothetical protein
MIVGLDSAAASVVTTRDESVADSYRRTPTMFSSSTRTIALLAAAGLIAAACSKKDDAKSASATGDEAATDDSKAEAAAPRPAPIDGPNLLPVTTKGGVSVAIPKSGWWFVASMKCYRAATDGGTGPSAMDMLSMQNPSLPATLAKMGIDPERDIVSLGAYDCGDEPCMYAALELRDPSKIKGALDGTNPGGPGSPAAFEQISDDHQVVKFKVPDTGADRHLHLHTVPVDWSAADAPTDEWAKDSRRATHALILYGVEPTTPAIDPLGILADAATARTRLAEVEGISSDPRDRCIAGSVSTGEEIKPGTVLTNARFVLNAPPRPSSDVAASALGSSRSVIVEVVLELDPAPTKAKVEQWIAEARAAVREMVGPMVPMMAGQLGQDVVNAFGAIIEAGFEWKIDGNKLLLSMSSRNVTDAELRASGALEIP